MPYQLLYIYLLFISKNKYTHHIYKIHLTILSLHSKFLNPIFIQLWLRVSIRDSIICFFKTRELLSNKIYYNHEELR